MRRPSGVIGISPRPACTASFFVTTQNSSHLIRLRRRETRVSSTFPRRLRELFERALEHPLRERAAFLDRECGEDRVLRRQVDALLSDHAAAGDFLETPHALMLAAAADFDRAVGLQIGRYKLERLIATGGMGCVFEARQEQPRRSVALK